MDHNFTHIVNGSSAAEALANAGVKGNFLPWDDVLHEGPRPQGLDLNQFSEIRANFIASCGWGDREETHYKFRMRNEKFTQAANEGNLLIWNSFELFDQLHLLEILNWFDQEGGEIPYPSIVFIEDYLGHTVSASEMQQYLAGIQTLNPNSITLGHQGWQAFTSDDPEMIRKFINLDLNSFPFMKKAMVRGLDELPDEEGLSKTARNVLEVLQNGAKTPVELFRKTQAKEDIRFMGDLSFWNILNKLAEKPHELISGEKGEYFPASGLDVGPSFLNQKIVLK